MERNAQTISSTVPLGKARYFSLIFAECSFAKRVGEHFEDSGFWREALRCYAAHIYVRMIESKWEYILILICLWFWCIISFLCNLKAMKKNPKLEENVRIGGLPYLAHFEPWLGVVANFRNGRSVVCSRVFCSMACCVAHNEWCIFPECAFGIF